MKHPYLLPLIVAFWFPANGQEKPVSMVADIDPSQIVDSTTYDLGDRLLTVQEVTEEVLPTPPPPPTEAPPTLNIAAPRNHISNARIMRILLLGATIYRSQGHSPYSLVTYHPLGSTVTVTFWSSADWSLLANIGTFSGPDGTIWELSLAYGIEDMDRRPAMLAKLGITYHAPQIPPFADGRAYFQIQTGEASAEQLLPIELLHSKYNSEYQQLKLAATAREAAESARAAEIQANPPVPEDIVVRYRILAPGEMDPK